MKSIIIVLSVAFLLITNVSCKPKAPEVNPEYVGSWSGYDGLGAYSISISENGMASYQGFNGLLTVTATGKARVKGTKFKIGVKKFYMSQGPTLISENGYSYYVMTLDGVVYERY